VGIYKHLKKRGPYKKKRTRQGGIGKGLGGDPDENAVEVMKYLNYGGVVGWRLITVRRHTQTKFWNQKNSDRRVPWYNRKVERRKNGGPKRQSLKGKKER